MCVSVLQTTMHRGQGWAWESAGGHGMTDGMNELLPCPLSALKETRDEKENMSPQQRNCARPGEPDMLLARVPTPTGSSLCVYTSQNRLLAVIHGVILMSREC